MSGQDDPDKLMQGAKRHGERHRRWLREGGDASVAGRLAQIDKVAQARAELEKANARFLLALRAKLTPEQWKALQAFRAERRDRRMWRRGGRGAGPGPGNGANAPAPPPSNPPQ